MQRLLCALAGFGLLVGCARPQAAGPKWPEPSTTADDGGESIEPHGSATYAAAVEKSADAEPEKPAAASTASTTAAAAAPAEDKLTPVPASTQPAPDDVFTSEEIIIEIED